MDSIILPRHLGIIMDGNGRWAQTRKKSRLTGHRQGAESVRNIVRACRKKGIPALTLYAFSQENWERPVSEIKGLMHLLQRFLKQERQTLQEQQIRLNSIGRLQQLPNNVRKLLFEVMQETQANQAMVLTLALSYGGQQEIVEAARKISELAQKGELIPAELDEKIFASYLMTHGLPELDLVIRTSGEIRISNFLLWQSAYAEFYFTNTNWPDFNEAELDLALQEFSQRQRRFGKTD